VVFSVKIDLNNLPSSHYLAVKSVRNLAIKNFFYKRHYQHIN